MLISKEFFFFFFVLSTGNGILKNESSVEIDICGDAYCIVPYQLIIFYIFGS